MEGQFCSRHWSHCNFVNKCQCRKHKCRMSTEWDIVPLLYLCDFLKNRFSGHRNFVLSITNINLQYIFTTQLIDRVTSLPSDKRFWNKLSDQTVIWIQVDSNICLGTGNITDKPPGQTYSLLYSVPFWHTDTWGNLIIITDLYSTFRSEDTEALERY